MPDKARRRARQRGAATGERVEFLPIAERDRWICQLCFLPVDPSKRWPAAGAGVLDHAQALALGGAHDPANVQLAHHLCNSAKGTGEAAMLRRVS